MNYLETLDALDGSTSADVLSQVASTYLAARNRIAIIDEVDEIHRHAILNHPVVTNPFYRRLSRRAVTAKHFERFSGQYLYASTRYFYTDVVPAGRDRHTNPSWQRYMQHILEEESSPKPHHQMFEEFLVSCGAKPGSPSIAAEEYAGAHMRGYTADLPFASGYALGVETQAGYEIALIYYGFAQIYRRQVQDTDFFRIHLAEGQEDEHAAASVSLIETVCETEDDVRRAKEGFKAFCDDAYKFMVEMDRFAVLQ